MPITEPFDFSKLSVAERILLAEALWDSVYEQAQQLPLSKEIKQELDRRFAAEEAGEMTYHSWEEVKAELSKK